MKKKQLMGWDGKRKKAAHSLQAGTIVVMNYCDSKYE
jgi:hypothetical protein